MKIVHYIPSIDEGSGGVGAYMQLMSRDLGKLCELHVITHKRSNERSLENCRIHYVPYKWLPWNNCKKEFLALLEEIGPDIFHTNCCWMPLSALMAKWAKKAGYKTVYTPHGMLEPYSIARFYWRKKLPAILMFQRRGVEVSDMVHATAESERDNLLALGWNPNVTVIPNCVNVEEIHLKHNGPQDGIGFSRNKNILFLSRIHPKKGIEILLEVISELRDQLKDYTVTLAGDGEAAYVNSLKDLASRNGIDHIVKFIGPVYGEAKWRLYAGADLFVLPSYSENFGIVVAEALASGVPVITTKGTPWQELETCNCGWWVNPTPDDLAKAIRDFLQKTDEELFEMGLNGRHLVEEKYDSRAVATQFINLYKQLSNNCQA